MTPARFNRKLSRAARLASLLPAGALICAVAVPLNAKAVSPGTNSTVVRFTNALIILDQKRVFALGMIETGNNDREIGALGEVSRYQIHPVVWKAYSPSRDYTNPEISIQVARQHWAALARYFKEKTGRDPGDFDMYILWNTKQGYYARRGFSPSRISPVVRNRAQRFVNLVNRKT